MLVYRNTQAVFSVWPVTFIVVPNDVYRPASATDAHVKWIVTKSLINLISLASVDKEKRTRVFFNTIRIIKTH
jgi:hypothetical protein